MTDTADHPRWLDYLPLDQLEPDDRNPKAHAADDIADSMGRWGYTAPMQLDERTGRLSAGHGRRAVLMRMHAAGDPPPEGVAVADDGTWLVPVVRGWASVDDTEAAGYLATDNYLTQKGGWLADPLESLMADVAASDQGLVGTGWVDEADVASFLAGLTVVEPEPEPEPGHTDPDDLPDPPPPVTQPGDLWQLGPHRLLCGDSTDPAAIERLLADGHADVVWTDPPYGVDYVGKTADALTIKNDGAGGIDALLDGAFDSILAAGRPGCPVYVAAPPGPAGIPFATKLHDRGLFRQRLVWVKDQFVLGHSDYHYRHEDIYLGYTPGPGIGRLGRGGADWHGDNAQASVLEFPRPRASEDHPTMKPVDLIAHCLRNSSTGGDVVLDLFGGSGSTLIAAHRLGRVARLVELDPQYCDVICRRWQAITGKQPVLERTGELHDFTTD